MESWPSWGAERGASGCGGGEVKVISLLKLDPTRFPLPGRDCLARGEPAGGVDCGEDCLAGDSDGDSKELISIAEVGPMRGHLYQIIKSRKSS